MVTDRAQPAGPDGGALQQAPATSPSAADPTATLNAVVVRALEMRQACGAELHRAFGVDPGDLLKVHYSDGAKIPACRSDVALTIVGEPRVALCPRFFAQAMGDLDEAAATLLHESLHVSGLRERPMAGATLTSHDIQNPVRAACKRPTAAQTVMPVSDRTK